MVKVFSRSEESRISWSKRKKERFHKRKLLQQNLNFLKGNVFVQSKNEWKKKKKKMGLPFLKIMLVYHT